MTGTDLHGLDEKDALDPGAIAVIGMACRFPGAETPDAFWNNLRDGVESITFFTEAELRAAGVDPKLINDPAYVPAKGVLEQADCFDAGFFGFSPREAALMDPQQRVFLECAWSAIEDAGYDPRSYPGAISVFAGGILSVYLVTNLWPNREVAATAGNFQMAVGNDSTFLATSTSYHLDLKGPSVSVGSACSTSLLAVHLACQSLLSHESDMALAGGVSVHLPLVSGYRYEDGGILSPDGHCRPFDADARGTVSSDGVGAVILKRLEDALEDGDCVHAVIRGSAVNNDGSGKVGFTAPSASGEARVITEALAVAGCAPADLHMVETHGAATPLGDPIEFSALAEVFDGAAPGRHALGSVKSNIGHLDAAAGIAGFIKTVQALRHRRIPPTLHFQAPNPEINLSDSPFWVNTALVDIPEEERPAMAGVSSFGIGGTNVHVVLEEAPPRETPPPGALPPFELLMLSARTSSALEAATDRLASHIEASPDLNLRDAAHTLRVGRRAMAHRRVLICADKADAVTGLRERDAKRMASAASADERASVAFMFPGLGDHYPGMGWELYVAEPVFRERIDSAAESLKRHLDGDIRDFLYPDQNWKHPRLEDLQIDDKAMVPRMNLKAMLGRDGAEAGNIDGASAGDDPILAQPAIFVTELALAELLASWGIRPDAMIGHSIGEFVAACLADVLSAEDALALVAARARLIRETAKPGAMLAVPMSEAALVDMLPPGVSIGAVNGENLCVASGEPDAVEALREMLAGQGGRAQVVRATRAYHSAMLKDAAAKLDEIARGITLRAPRIPYISCISGDWITEAEATDPGYWGEHLVRTVRFRDGVSRLLGRPGGLLMEVGPGQGLTSHAIAERTRMAECDDPVIPTLRWSYDAQSETAVLLRAVGQAWLSGAPVDMTRFRAPERPRRVPLPTYPFERQRYWIDPPGDEARDAGISERREDIADWFYLPSWKPSARPINQCPTGAGRETETTPDVVLLFLDRLGVGVELARRWQQAGATVITVEVGAGLADHGDRVTIDPAQPSDHVDLLRLITERGAAPSRVVHMWSLTPITDEAPSEARLGATRRLGYDSLVNLVQALAREGLTDGLALDVITNASQDVDGVDVVAPEKAMIRAPIMVAGQEHPGLTARLIDLDITPGATALTDLLEAEISGPARDPLVAYRRGRRWVRGHEPVRLPDSVLGPPTLRDRGVYLLTGGLGGVGQVLARHLARAARARLVLVGRTGLPDRAAWPRRLEDGDAMADRIRAVMDLEELGADVLVLSADVSDPEAMRRVVETAERRFGGLHGVIHGAGAVGIETFHEIARASPRDADGQFTAKVRGLMVLAEVLDGKDLDFCLLMSSLSAVLGGIGFSAYAAGNLFMDAFARWKTSTGATGWVSVDWDSWRLEDTQPVVAGLGATVSGFVMEPEEGAEAFQRILAAGDLDHVIVSSGNLDARLRQWIEPGGALTDSSMSAMMHARPTLAEDYVAPRGELETRLAELWGGLFGIEKVGVHDNFFELGGHSLLATQLNARIAATLRIDLSLATLLAAPTIAELAVEIVDQQAEEVDPDILEELLAEVGGLSEAELAVALGELDADGDVTGTENENA